MQIQPGTFFLNARFRSLWLLVSSGLVERDFATGAPWLSAKRAQEIARPGESDSDAEKAKDSWQGPELEGWPSSEFDTCVTFVPRFVAAREAYRLII